MRRPSTFLIVPSLLVALGAPALAAPASLRALEGTVEVQRNRQGDWQPVETGTVDSGDRIRTGPKASAFLTLPDDHRVAIGPDAYVTLERLDPGHTKLFVKMGSIRNKVRRLNLEKGESYRVQTPSIVVAVRGTDFSVNPRAVHVFEGHVDLSALKKDLAKQVTQLTAGQSARVESNGQIQPMESREPSPQNPATAPANKPGEPASNDSKDPSQKQGPPPPPTPPASGGGMSWWDHPESMKGQPGFFGDDALEPRKPEGRPPEGPKPSMRLSENPFGDPYPKDSNVMPPPVPPGGTDNTIGAPAVGLDALIDTMRSQNLHNQADAILVADLYQRHAVATDPFTGQLRQYADAIARNGSDGIRFLNATMIAGVPGSLNYTNTVTRFNLPLPSQYWIATQSAFGAGTGVGMPSYYATQYQSDVSNTVDHLIVTASGGNTVYDSTTDRYRTVFTDMRAQINNTMLWDKKGSNWTFLGGSAPTRTQLMTGKADIDIIDTYGTGDFFRVRNTVSSPDGKILSLADLPANAIPQEYLKGQNMRTTIRSNLLSKGSLDIFGSVEARALSGSLHLDNADALNILGGYKGPYTTAPIGLYPG